MLRICRLQHGRPSPTRDVQQVSSRIDREHVWIIDIASRSLWSCLVSVDGQAALQFELPILRPLAILAGFPSLLYGVAGEDVVLRVLLKR